MGVQVWGLLLVPTLGRQEAEESLGVLRQGGDEGCGVPFLRPLLLVEHDNLGEELEDIICLWFPLFLWESELLDEGGNNGPRFCLF